MPLAIVARPSRRNGLPSHPVSSRVCLFDRLDLQPGITGAGKAPDVVWQGASAAAATRTANSPWCGRYPSLAPLEGFHQSSTAPG